MQNSMDEKTKLEQYAEMQALVQKEIETQFPKLYQQYATKYGVASVPLHTHNGVDSPTIGNESVFNFTRLPASESTPQYIPAGATGPGVASLSQLAGQVIDNPVGSALGNPSTVFVMPLPIVWGQGVGVQSQFNGGNAPEGSTLVFHNSETRALNQFWWRADGKWYGVIATLGPMS